MIELKGYEGLLSLMGVYSLVILAMSGSLYVWASYNIIRFSGMTRRVPRALVTLETQARILKVSPVDLATWQKSQMIFVEHGKIHTIAVDSILAEQVLGPDKPSPAYKPARIRVE
jgi:poly-beta-1,6-N-acetyl-D-glucosamine biosynthesis protein PgaD